MTKEKRSILAGNLLLSALVLGTYANSLHGELILDSKLIILESPRVQAATIENLWQILDHAYWWPHLIDQSYRPLTTLSFLFNYAILGDGESPPGYHAVNLALHWLNVLLAFQLARRILGEWRTALIAAALFAAHPLGTEAVSNIVGRADLLATLATLTALLAHIRSRRARHPLPWQIVVALATLFGLLSKENAATIPALILLYEWLPRRDAAPTAPRWKRLAGELCLLALAFASVGLLRQRANGGIAPWQTQFTENVLISGNLLSSRLTAIKVLGQQLAQVVWPARLCCDYSVDQTRLFDPSLANTEDLWALPALVAFAAVLASVPTLRRRSPSGLFYLGFAAITVLPTANLLVLIESSRGDRFLYLPLVGLTGLAALVLGRLAGLSTVAADQPSSSRRRRLVFLFAAAAVLALATRSRARNADWQDALTLGAHDSLACPRSYRIHQWYGGELARSGPEHLDAAIVEAETAQTIVDRHAERFGLPRPAVDNLGQMYVDKASRVPPGERREWFEKAVAALEHAVGWEQGVDERYRRAATTHGLDPDGIRPLGTPARYLDLARAYRALGQLDPAITTLQQGRLVAANDARFPDAIASALSEAARHDEAAVYLFLTFLCDGSRKDVWPRLQEIYRSLDGGSCAFPGGRLDLACPLVKQHFCRALAVQARTFVDAHAPAGVAQLREAAKAQQCPEEISGMR